MRTVNIAKLKARLSEYIRAARAGETIRILDRRQEVARLSGVSTKKGMRAAQTLVDRGLAEWRGGKPKIKSLKPRKGPAHLADAVLEDRG
jgi:antitoxin (DNA-binding transcriptional repressor) of toxin-antitoxin stability system